MLADVTDVTLPGFWISCLQAIPMAFRTWIVTFGISRVL